MELEGWTSPFAQAEVASPPPCPIVLDLDGDGTESVAISAGAYFDHNADGFAEATGWVGPDDGLLVWDRNEDGEINSGRELFGNQTLLQNNQLAADGFAALAEWDANSDGKIDASDAVWADLKIWVDANGDGVSASDELFSFTDLGIASISLSHTAGSGVDAQGNNLALTGTFTWTDSTTSQVADYLFQRDTTLTIPEEWLSETSEVAALPDVTGFGTVYDLHQAVLRSSSRSSPATPSTPAATPGSSSASARPPIIPLPWSFPRGSTSRDSS
jgi:hypothetical protein